MSAHLRECDDVLVGRTLTHRERGTIMAKYATRKRGLRGREETLRRKSARNVKRRQYALVDASGMVVEGTD